MILRALVLSLLLAAPLVGAAGVRAHGGGTRLSQGQAAWLNFDVLSALRRTTAVKTVSACTAETRAEQLRTAQHEILQMLLPAPGVDLTTLRDETDLAALAALGYDVYPHREVSFAGMGWSVLDGLAPQDPVDATPAPGRPSLLLYEPNGENVISPDGFDFPYRLRGWAYIFPYTFGRHPTVYAPSQGGLPFLTCVAREEWFVHERGIHPFDTGGMTPIPPVEELQGQTPHGTAAGGLAEDVLAQLTPGDIPHARAWDLHVWLDGDDVPTVWMLNPGAPIPGIDPGVGISPPPNWPDQPYPAFYYPQRATDLSVTLADSPDPVAIGSNITYAISLPNAGPNVAMNVRLSDDVPANTTFVSLEQTSGPSATCTTPSAGGTGTVSCTIASLDAGASASFALLVKVDGGVASGTTITNEATVTSATVDHVGANNTAIAETATTGPTAVRLRSFVGEASARGPLLRWRTASETGTLGFNLFREQNGKRIRVNVSLIAARGEAAGSSYAYRDRRAPSGGRPLRYWLQVVGVSASPAWYGPVRVAPVR